MFLFGFQNFQNAKNLTFSGGVVCADSEYMLGVPS
jgi:hypothetical protein